MKDSWRLVMASYKIRKAVIPAAGLGLRFYPLTRAQPKEMLPVLDKPVIHYVVDEAVRSGLDEILIIIGAGKDSIINYFDVNKMDERFLGHGFDSFPDIFFVRQKAQLGLGDSIRYAEKFVNGDPFVVLLGDTIYRSSISETVTTQLINVFRRYEKSTIAVEKVPYEKISDYGIISGKQIEPGIWEIESMKEKPKPEEALSDMGITGTYVLTDDIFQKIQDLRPSKNGEYQLTDALAALSEVHMTIGSEFKGKRYDIGTKELWIKAFFEFARDDQRFSSLI